MVENSAKRAGISIRVADSGIGISRADMKNLFKMNFQTKNEASRRKNMGGHGVGLNVCK
jgi:signal transduction histidine kinase